MKNTEIEKILGSLDGISKVEPTPFFYDRVKMRISNTQAKLVSIAPTTIWKAAACFAALVALNIFIWLRSGDNEKMQAQESNPIAQEYFSYLNTNSQF